jgi:hypothetical protein
METLPGTPVDNKTTGCYYTMYGLEVIRNEGIFYHIGKKLTALDLLFVIHKMLCLSFPGFR